MTFVNLGRPVDTDGMKLSPPPFTIVAEGYAPNEVDALILKLARRARGEVAELRAQIDDLEAELARYRAAALPAPDPTPPPTPAEEHDQEVDWALAAVGRSPYDSWNDDQRQRAIMSLRGRRMSACG
jgi:hypothetical protein